MDLHGAVAVLRRVLRDDLDAVGAAEAAEGDGEAHRRQVGGHVRDPDQEQQLRLG